MMSSHFDRYITKLIQVLMHLRIDVKKDQTEHFQRLLAKKKKSEPLQKTINEFFDFIVKEDLYDVGNKAMEKKQGNVVTIKVSFTFVSKQTQCSQLAESWYFQFKQRNGEASQLEQQPLSQIQAAFQQFVSFLVKLPLWEKFWGNFQKRKQIKKQYTLVYKIEYNKPPSNNILRYNKRVEKQMCVLAIQTSIVLEYRTDFIKLFACFKEDIEKTVIIREKEENPRKKSLYEFYDHEFDITFVSSDSELTSIPNKEMRVVGSVDEQSDEQYEIIIDENVDVATEAFKRGLRQIAEDVDIVMEKYF